MKLKIEREEETVEGIQELDFPFVASSPNGEQVYLISNFYAHVGLIVTSLVDGTTYDFDYSEDEVRSFLREGKWVLREATLVLK